MRPPQDSVLFRAYGSLPSRGWAIHLFTPLSPSYLAAEAPETAAFRAKHLYPRELKVAYTFGTVLLYRHDTWHRGTQITPGASRLVQNMTFARSYDLCSVLHVGWSWAMYSRAQVGGVAVWWVLSGGEAYPLHKRSCVIENRYIYQEPILNVVIWTRLDDGATCGVPHTSPAYRAWLSGTWPSLLDTGKEPFTGPESSLDLGCSSRRSPLTILSKPWPRWRHAMAVLASIQHPTVTVCVYLCLNETRS